MDLELYGRVLWRFRLLVAGGLILAIALTFFSFARVDLSSGRITYRAKEQWASYSQIFVTQPGFPYGSLRPGGGPSPPELAVNALFYAKVATTDPVMNLAFGTKRPTGSVEAAALSTSATNTDTLPIISIAGLADSAAQAMYLARSETRALIAWVESRQVRSSTPVKDRIVLQVIQKPVAATLLRGRSKTVPIVVFLTAMAAVIGMAFILENLRPRVRVIANQGVTENEEESPSVKKRSA